MALKTKNKLSLEILVQMVFTLFAFYAANRIGIDIWRSMTGH
jgi:hypothetical protein